MRGRANVLLTALGVGLLAFGIATEKGAMHWPGQSYGADALAQASGGPMVPCSKLSVTVSPSGSSAIGKPVTVRASASQCLQPIYQFSVEAPGSGTYAVVRPYSRSETFVWNTAGLAPGTYHLSVWARDTSSTRDKDVVDTAIAHELNSCTSIDVATTPAGKAEVGHVVEVTGAATGCSDEKLLYEFWLLPPGSSAYQLVQPYSTSPVLRWNTAGSAPGMYRIAVWARDSAGVGTSSNSLGSWDVADTMPYTLSSCGAVAASADPSSPASAGTTVRITASATGCAGSRYEFWMLTPGSTTWRNLQSYSSNATLTWMTAGNAKGTYRISIWVRDAGSSGLYGDALGTWDAASTIAYTLS